MRNYLLFILSFLTLLDNAQGFRSRYYHPGGETNLSKAVFEATAGTYIGGGFTVDTTNGGYSPKLCIMGLNSQGQVQWTKKYGNSKFQYLNNSFISRSYYKKGTNVYYAGAARDSNNKFIGVFIKFNLNGDTLWQKRFYDANDYVYPQMVTNSVDGGFILTGMFEDPVNVGRRLLVIKTDANGNELWRKKIAKTGPNVQDGKAIVQDAVTKKIAIVGYQYSPGADIFDNLVILDSLGTTLYRGMFTNDGAVLVDLIQTQDHNFVAVGTAYSTQTIGGNHLAQSFIVKFNINDPANYIWKIMDFDKLVLNNAFTCIRELANEELLIGGLLDTMQMNNLPTNCLTRYTKIDKNGHVTGNAYYDYKINAATSDNNLTIKSLELTTDGGWVAAIECVNFPSPNPFFFVKYDGNGCDSTLAYCTAVASGIRDIKTGVGEISIYPNPSNGILNINSKNAMFEKGLLISFIDLYGREVKRIKTENENNSFDIKDLNNGLYLLKISTSDGRVLYHGKLLKE